MRTGPSKISAAATLQGLQAARVIAVVRARDGDEAVAIAEAVAAGGVQAIELTFTTPGAPAAIVQARGRLAKEVLVGAGTVTSAEHVRAATIAGADFLVSPHLDRELLDEMLRTELLCLPGVLTPTEVAAAIGAGAAAVKLFPACTAGLAHLKALLGPFPNLQVVPSGGIGRAEAIQWLAAGAIAVSIGSELLPERLRRTGAWGEISRHVSGVLSQLAEAQA